MKRTYYVVEKSAASDRWHRVIGFETDNCGAAIAEAERYADFYRGFSYGVQSEVVHRKIVYIVDRDADDDGQV